jgi:hypothetical protein
MLTLGCGLWTHGCVVRRLVLVWRMRMGAAQEATRESLLMLWLAATPNQRLLVLFKLVVEFIIFTGQFIDLFSK